MTIESVTCLVNSIGIINSEFLVWIKVGSTTAKVTDLHKLLSVMRQSSKFYNVETSWQRTRQLSG